VGLENIPGTRPCGTRPNKQTNNKHYFLFVPGRRASGQAGGRAGKRAGRYTLFFSFLKKVFIFCPNENQHAACMWLYI
jgi:hypothetical protein